MAEKRSCGSTPRPRGPVQLSKRIQPSLLTFVQPLKPEPHLKTPGVKTPDAVRVGGTQERGEFGAPSKNGGQHMGNGFARDLMQDAADNETGRCGDRNGLVRSNDSNFGKCLGQEMQISVKRHTGDVCTRPNSASLTRRENSVLAETSIGGDPKTNCSKAQGKAARALEKRLSFEWKTASEVERQTGKRVADDKARSPFEVSRAGLPSMGLRRPLVKGVDYVADSEDEEDDALEQPHRLQTGGHARASPNPTPNSSCTGYPLNPPQNVTPKSSCLQPEQAQPLSFNPNRSGGAVRDQTPSKSSSHLTPPHVFPGFQTRPVLRSPAERNPLFETPSVASGPNKRARVSSNQPDNPQTPSLAPTTRTVTGTFVSPNPGSTFGRKPGADISKTAGLKLDDVIDESAHCGADVAKRRSFSGQPAVSSNPSMTPAPKPTEFVHNTQRSTSKPFFTIPGLTVKPTGLSSKPPRLAHSRVRQDETIPAVGTRLRAIRKRSKVDDLDPPSFSLGIGEASEVPSFDLGLGSDDEREFARGLGQKGLRKPVAVTEEGLAGTSRGSKAAKRGSEGGLKVGLGVGLEGSLGGLDGLLQGGLEAGLEGSLGGLKGEVGADLGGDSKADAEGGLAAGFGAGLGAGLVRHNRFDTQSPVARLAKGLNHTEWVNRTGEKRKSSTGRSERSETVSVNAGPSTGFPKGPPKGAFPGSRTPASAAPNGATFPKRGTAKLSEGGVENFADSDEEDQALLSTNFRSASKSRTPGCPSWHIEFGSGMGLGARLGPGQRMEVDLTGEPVDEAAKGRTSDKAPSTSDRTEAPKRAVSEGNRSDARQVSDKIGSRFGMGSDRVETGPGRVSTKTGLVFGGVPDKTGSGFGRVSDGVKTSFGRVSEKTGSGFGRVSDKTDLGFGRVSDGVETGPGRVSDGFRTPPVLPQKWRRLQKSARAGEQQSDGAETPSEYARSVRVRKMELGREADGGPLDGSAPMDDEIEDFSSPEKATIGSALKGTTHRASACPRQPQETTTANGSLPRGPAFPRTPISPAPSVEPPKSCRRPAETDQKGVREKPSTSTKRLVDETGGLAAMTPGLQKRSVERPGVLAAAKAGVRNRSVEGHGDVAAANPSTRKRSVEGTGDPTATKPGVRKRSVEELGVLDVEKNRPSMSAWRGRKSDGNWSEWPGNASERSATVSRSRLSNPSDGFGDRGPSERKAEGKKRSGESPSWVEREAKNGKRWAGFGAAKDTAATKSDSAGAGSLDGFEAAGFGGFGSASERTYPHFGPAAVEDDVTEGDPFNALPDECSPGAGEGFGSLGEQTAGRAWSPPPPDFASQEEEERNWRSGRTPVPTVLRRAENGTPEQRGLAGHPGVDWEERTETDWLREYGTGRNGTDGMGGTGGTDDLSGRLGMGGMNGVGGMRGMGDTDGMWGNGMGWNGIGRDGTTGDGTGQNGPGRNGIGMDGTGRNGTGTSGNRTDGNGTDGAGTESVVRLLRERLPHYKPLDILMREGGFDNEPIFIDYRNQFSDVTSGGATGRSSAAEKPTGRRRTAGPVHAAGAAEKGHWTTLDGKKVYVNKTGKTLEGRAAYRSHLKDSGAQPKTRRKKPRKKGSRRKG